MHLEKNPTYACTFKVQRKEINVVKVCFTMRYSSGKLSNDKVITTACNFWRQIACSFQVMSGNILFSGKKIFEIPPFFQTRLGDLGKKVHACSLRFSALNNWARCTKRRGFRYEAIYTYLYLTRFMQGLSGVLWNRASERKVLLAQVRVVNFASW